MASKLTKENLSRLAHARGFRGVAGLARRVGRHRVSIYRALKNPNQNRPTMRAIERALFR